MYLVLGLYLRRFYQEENPFQFMGSILIKDPYFGLTLESIVNMRIPFNLRDLTYDRVNVDENPYIFTRSHFRFCECHI